MTTLTVWKFDSPEGADAAEETLVELAKQQLITIEDAATVSWREGKKGPKTRQTSLAGPAALGGAFWGFLFGLLFFVPLLGMAMGAAAGGAVGSLAKVGIDDDFVKSVRTEVTPGTSALFLLSSDTVLDAVHEAFTQYKPTLIRSNLSGREERLLREAFGLD
jgi:uncharacterized membrane protein